MVFYHGQGGTKFYSHKDIGREDGQALVEVKKMESPPKCPRCSGENIDVEDEEPLLLCSDCGLIYRPDGTFMSQSDKE